MPLSWNLALLAVLSAPDSSTSLSTAATFQAPAPRLLETLRRQHNEWDWLFVYTPSSRTELRVEALDERGLVGIRVRNGPRPADPMPWTQIARIERRKSHQFALRATGTILGSVAGGYIGAAIEESGDRSGEDAKNVATLVGATIGGVAGYWIGGRVGARTVRGEPWYVATPVGAPVAPAAAVRNTAVDSAGAAARFHNSARDEDVLRVSGSFGEFIGRASNVTDQGFAGLAPDHRLDLGAPLPAEPISWSQIEKVERRTGSSGRGALIGGILFGTVVGILAGGVSSGFGSSEEDVAGAAAAGVVAGGAVGAGIGALIGTGSPRWKVMYRAE